MIALKYLCSSLRLGFKLPKTVLVLLVALLLSTILVILVAIYARLCELGGISEAHILTPYLQPYSRSEVR